MTRLRIGWSVAAPDGTKLVADVYLPATLPAPAVVLRTPYGRAAHRAEGAGWAERGFAFVVQDVRGRYDSEGTWALYSNERGDGAALIDAVVAADWSDGRVMTCGGSYAGFTAWTAAVERPQHVRAVVSTGPSMGLHRVKWDRSGILRLAEHATWWLERADSRTSRDGAVAAVLGADPRALWHLPVRDIPTRLGAELPGWRAVVDAGPGAPPDEEVTDVELDAFAGAVLHVGGWHDLLVADTLHQWRRAGSAHDPRPPRRLVIGPWDHSFVWGGSTSVGARDHGEASRLPLGDLQVSWLREVLAGRAASGVEVFEVGSGWSRARDWPPPTTALTLWPDMAGDLVAEPRPPGDRNFRNDPADPYPSAAEAADRTSLTGRHDVLRFTGAVLGQALSLAGVARAHLVAHPAGPTCDWVVRLLELRADGALISLAAGTATHAPADIDLDPVAIRLPAGSRLVLEVTGADFPRLARNLGGSVDRYTGVRTEPLDQHLVVGAGTYLQLPVVA